MHSGERKVSWSPRPPGTVPVLPLLLQLSCLPVGMRRTIQRVWLLVIIGSCTCYPSAVDAAFKLLHLQIAKLLSSTSGNLLEGSCFTSTIIMPDPLLSRSLKLPALVRVLECRSKFEKRMGPFTHWDTIWTCVWPLLKTCEDTVLRHSVYVLLKLLVVLIGQFCPLNLLYFSTVPCASVRGVNPDI